MSNTLFFLPPLRGKVARVPQGAGRMRGRFSQYRMAQNSLNRPLIQRSA